jgi:hypothetical protein
VIAAIGERPIHGERPSMRVGIATGLVVVGAPIGEGDARQQTAIGGTPNLDFSNANVSGRRTRPSSAFQWYAGSGLLVIWRGSRHARAITFGFP